MSRDKQKKHIKTMGKNEQQFKVFPYYQWLFFHAETHSLYLGLLPIDLLLFTVYFCKTAFCIVLFKLLLL